MKPSTAVPPVLTALKDLRKGQAFRVMKIDSAEMRTQLIRFGVGEGSTAVCHERIPFGPIVIKHRRQEIALGRELAAAIWVELLAA